MMATPAAIVAIVAVDLVAGIAVAALALVAARTLGPRVEAWCARHPNAAVAALAVAEDAAVPQQAKDRARALVLSRLDAGQRRSWHLRRRIDVVASSGRRYTIAPYRPFNVRAGDALFCLQVVGTIPVYDKLLAQKLLLESDEHAFLARANVRTFSRAWEARVAAARAGSTPT
jgi:hypothetical protein